MKFNDLISDMERFAKKENVPIMQKERLFIADVFDRAFDLGKQDYTIIGVGAA